jgi:hypothetical protein
MDFSLENDGNEDGVNPFIKLYVGLPILLSQNYAADNGIVRNGKVVVVKVSDVQNVVNL